MTDQTAPHPFQAAMQARAWSDYIAETGPARDKYRQLLEEHHAYYSQAVDEAQAMMDAVTRQAWERYQCAANSAWEDFIADTAAARTRREQSVLGTHQGMLA